MYTMLYACAASLSLIACASADGEMEAYPPREVKAPVIVDIKKSPAGAYVEYSAFGAAADGKHDDFNALFAAHRYANEKGLPVRADRGGTYYLGGSDQAIPVQTDTDWGDARFIIDDRRCRNRTAPVFAVTSKTPPYAVKGVKTLVKGARNLGRPLDTDCLVIIMNNNVRRYIRYGLNQNAGYPQGDVCIVRQNGDIDADTPVLRDYKEITSLTAHPIDEWGLTVRGGVFTTIANRDPSRYTYYKRGITIQRSRVTVENVTHYITGEQDHGAPYAGFISVRRCAAVRIKNCILTGHKTYGTVGSAGKKVSMGSYDLAADGAVNVFFEHCTQTNDILDTRYWGILASNGVGGMITFSDSVSLFLAGGLHIAGRFLISYLTLGPGATAQLVFNFGTGIGLTLGVSASYDFIDMMKAVFGQDPLMGGFTISPCITIVFF